MHRRVRQWSSTSIDAKQARQGKGKIFHSGIAVHKGNANMQTQGKWWAHPKLGEGILKEGEGILKEGEGNGERLIPPVVPNVLSSLGRNANLWAPQTPVFFPPLLFFIIILANPDSPQPVPAQFTHQGQTPADKFLGFKVQGSGTTARNAQLEEMGFEGRSKNSHPRNSSPSRMDS